MRLPNFAYAVRHHISVINQAKLKKLDDDLGAVARDAALRRPTDPCVLLKTEGWCNLP